MQIPSTTATTATQNANASQQSSSSSSTTSGANLDYNAFLRLLIAQMKNQDPTNPTDPAQWMGQIAQFSNVEQSIQTNAKLDSLMTQMSLSQVDGLIGKTITSDDGSVSGKVQSVRIVTGGTVAVLDSGQQVMLGSGLKIS
jgi:flagellar basal-body rod modification protein FlgD